MASAHSLIAPPRLANARVHLGIGIGERAVDGPVAVLIPIVGDEGEVHQPLYAMLMRDGEQLVIAESHPRIELRQIRNVRARGRGVVWSLPRVKRLPRFIQDQL